jgi:hypothetical protein
MRPRRSAGPTAIARGLRLLLLCAPASRGLCACRCVPAPAICPCHPPPGAALAAAAPPHIDTGAVQGILPATKERRDMICECASLVTRVLVKHALFNGAAGLWAGSNAQRWRQHEGAVVCACACRLHGHCRRAPHQRRLFISPRTGDIPCSAHPTLAKIHQLYASMMDDEDELRPVGPAVALPGRPRRPRAIHSESALCGVMAVHGECWVRTAWAVELVARQAGGAHVQPLEPTAAARGRQAHVVHAREAQAAGARAHRVRPAELYLRQGVPSSDSIAPVHAPAHPGASAEGTVLSQGRVGAVAAAQGNPEQRGCGEDDAAHRGARRRDGGRQLRPGARLARAADPDRAPGSVARLATLVV